MSYLAKRCHKLLLILCLTASAGAEIPFAKDAPQPKTTAQSADAVRLPPGFHLQLVAAEPLVQDPTCVAFDASGRMFVCELHGYNVEGHLDVQQLNETGQLDHQVRRLRWELLGGPIAEQARKLQYGIVKLLIDTNADGRMDEVRIWADDLPPCYGIVPARDGVIVTCAPHVIYLADEDHDGQVDHRETLFTGFRTSVMERGINNPRWGLDNWIYVGSGQHAGTITGPRLRSPVDLGNTDFRMRPDGSAIEPVSGQVGTFGLAMNDLGQRFPSSGGEPAVYALPLPRRYLVRNPFVATPRTNYSAADYARGYRISQPHPWRVRRGQDPAWIKFYGTRETNSNYFSGGCGGFIYRGGDFPSEYYDSFFYCEPSLNIVHRAVLERDGAGFKAHRAAGEAKREFLASTDQWFRPINLRMGPDDALYIVDMYREIIEDYSAIPRFLQQQYGLNNGSDRGRIWRLSYHAVNRPKGDPAATRPAVGSRDRLPASQPAAALVDALAHRNPWWRETAQRLLVERRERSSIQPLRDMVANSESFQARLHALYVLHALDALRPVDLLRAMADSHYGVRLHAIRLADSRLNDTPGLLEKMLTLADDVDPSVRLQVAMSLGEANDPRAAASLKQMAQRHGDERWMDAAIASSARQTAGQLLLALLKDDASIQPVQPILPLLARTVAGTGDRTNVEAIVQRIPAQTPAVQQVCLAALADAAKASSSPADCSTPTREALALLIRTPSPEVRLAAATLVDRFGLAAEQPFVELFAQAARVAVSNGATGDGKGNEAAADNTGDNIDADTAAAGTRLSLKERRDAIELLSHGPWPVIRSALSELLKPQEAQDLQQAALMAIGRRSEPQVATVLLSRWPELSPSLRRDALQVLSERKNRLEALLDAVHEGLVQPVEIDPALRELLRRHDDQQIASRAKQLLPERHQDENLQRRLREYVQALHLEPNIDRGKQIFQKHCANCHRIGAEGFAVGPPLTTAMNRPDEAVLLDILDPNQRVDSEFASYVIQTRDGRSFSGLLISESATSVTLGRDKGVTHRILRSDIDLMRSSDVSLMPSNLYEQISPEDAADLIAFLRTSLSESALSNTQ